MARARNIKPSFFANEHLAECDPFARLLFAGLWCLADREGRLEDRPKRIRAELFPYDNCDAEALLAQLEQHGFITRYAQGEHRYIQVLNFCKHQNPHVKEAKSTIPAQEQTEPAPVEHSASTVQAPVSHQKSPADSLIPDSLSLDLLIPEEDQNHSLCVGEGMLVSGEPPAEPDEPADGVELVDPKAPVEMTLAWMPDANLLKTYCVHYGVSTDLFTKDAVAPFTAHHETGGSLNTQAKWVSLLVKWVKGDKDKASNVRQFPPRETQSRHTGFADRDYTAGLTQREDGTYAF